MNQCLALATVAVKVIISWIFLVSIEHNISSFLKIFFYLLSVKKYPRKYNVKINFLFSRYICAKIKGNLLLTTIWPHQFSTCTSTTEQWQPICVFEQNKSVIKTFPLTSERERKLQIHFPRLYVATLLVYFEVGGVLLCLSPSCF